MEKSSSKLILVIMVLSVFASLLAGIPVGVAADSSMAEDTVIAIFQPEQPFVDPRWTGDILLAGDPDVDEMNPRMASASNGDLYAVVEEEGGTYDIRIFKSTDGGETWLWLWAIYGIYYEIMNPDIAVGEGAEDWVFVVYELGDEVWVFRFSFDGLSYDWELVDSNPSFGVKYPRITTDCIDYPSNYYVYVAYDRGTLGLINETRQDYWELWFARSLDFGDTYVDQTFLWLYWRSQLARPDIAYGDEYVYVSFENWDGPDDSNVYVMRNTLYGNPGSWDAAVQVSTSTDQEWDSAVAATNGGGVVVVAYTRWYNNMEDLDVWYSYSYDWGVSWTTDWWLSSPSYEDDKSPDLAVSNSYGRIHAVYWSNYDVIYKSTDYSTPDFLGGASPEVMNEENYASSAYSWMTVAVNPAQPTETEACAAWTDFRNPTYDVFFDANYITVGLSISVYTDKYYYSAGDKLALGIDIQNPGSAVTVCVEIWVVKPVGPPVVFLHKHAITLKAGLDYSNPSQMTFGPLPSIPLGVYTWHAAILDPVTHDIIVEDTAPCEFV